MEVKKTIPFGEECHLLPELFFSDLGETNVQIKFIR